jgi:hypothetical protein
MIGRCSDDSNPDYGGRGIKVCERWLAFENFLKDMGERPKGLTIERMSNVGDYEPGNCRWATDREQNWNKGDTILVPYGGALMPLKEVARRTGVKYQRLHFWFRKKGLPLDQAIARTKIVGRWAT